LIRLEVHSLGNQEYSQRYCVNPPALAYVVVVSAELASLPLIVEDSVLNSTVRSPSSNWLSGCVGKQHGLPGGSRGTKSGIVYFPKAGLWVVLV
jgi:hypothetical protein